MRDQKLSKSRAKSALPEHETKRKAILCAAMELVVEGGFHSAPMSAIMKRAGASAGVIYHHFASKEEIFREIYERARNLKREKLLDGYKPSMEAKEGFLLLAMNAYAFYRKHQKELRYVSLYEDARFPISEVAQKLSPEALQFQRRYSPRSLGGIFADLPPEVIQEMTFGLISRLAQRPKKLPDAAIREVAERVWNALL